MKRINNLFGKVVVYNNFLLADSNARKNKKHYKEIKEHENKLLDVKTSIKKFQNMKELLENDIIDYINGIDVIEFNKKIEVISDLDYFTMYIDVTIQRIMME